jgi:hypothetical protein
MAYTFGRTALPSNALGYAAPVVIDLTKVKDEPVSPAPAPVVEEDDQYKCAITGDYMHDPVHAADGFAYDHDAILQWLSHGGNARTEMVKSPRTNTPMTKHLFRSFDFYQNYKAWCERTGRPLPLATTTFGLLSVPAPAPAPPAVQTIPPLAVREIRPEIRRVLNEVPVTAPAVRLDPITFPVRCIGVRDTFTLKTTLPEVAALFTERSFLRHRLEGLSLVQLRSLYSANVDAATSGLSKQWLIDFLSASIEAHSAAGKDTLSGRVMYNLPADVDGRNVILNVSATALLARKLFKHRTFIPAIVGRLTIHEMEIIADWNDLPLPTRGCSKGRVVAHLSALLTEFCIAGI